jgi:small GTP-binding protein
MGVPFPSLYKVMLLGDGNVGKTSLARRYCEGKFEESRVLTIGVDFQTKVVQLPGNEVKLSIWDVAGQPRFQVVRETFYRGCRAAALVFDLCNLESLKNLIQWVKEIRQFAPEVKFLVVGNKLDLVNENKVKDGGLFADHFKAPYIETSAKTGFGVGELFTSLAELANEKSVN